MSTREVIVIEGQKDSKKFIGAYEKKDWEEKKRDWGKNRTITIITEKTIPMEKEEMKNLFNLKTNDCAAYLQKIKTYLGTAMTETNETPTDDKLSEAKAE
ncbi:MAG: hypothetical protein NTX91_05550 [candidate division SR1 bacterium]|nr:hypothetical protein [candidate division SR1 bacterium]